MVPRLKECNIEAFSGLRAHLAVRIVGGSAGGP